MKKRITSRFKKVRLDEIDDKLIREVKIFKKELKKHMLTFIVNAFGFVAALVWRDSIRSIIDTILNSAWFIQKFPLKQRWLLQTITAVFVTIIAVFGIIVATKLIKPEEEDET